MKAVIAILALVIAASAIDTENAFQSWRMANHKFYATPEEYHKRLAIFSENYDRVQKFNAEGHSFEVGMGYFSDLSTPEFAALYTMGARPRVTGNHGKSYEAFGKVAAESVDWREKGIVNKVKDQGQCGSCWSFGANAAMEAAYAQATGKLNSFSEQNILDCAWSYGNEACNGGWHNSAMDYVIDNKGIDSSAAYPYTAKSSTTCKYKAADSAGSISSYDTVPSGDEDALQTAVSEGVVTIAIDASNWSFQMYKSGVYDEPACSPEDLDHAVAIVGYGHDSASNKDYWTVRNSWGSSWGLQGYILMKRNDNNQCGVATAAYLAHA